MKSILIIIVFVFIFLNSYSQLKDIPRLTLGIEKEFLDSKKEFIFKPNCMLKIKTKVGEKYYSKDYTFSYKFLVMNQKDTINFDDISLIKGKIYNYSGNKILGVITVVFASPIAAFGLLDLVFEGDPGAAIVGVLFTGITYAGINLAGARKFHLRRDCILKVFDQFKK